MKEAPGTSDPKKDEDTSSYSSQDEFSDHDFED